MLYSIIVNYKFIIAAICALIVFPILFIAVKKGAKSYIFKKQTLKKALRLNVWMYILLALVFITNSMYVVQRHSMDANATLNLAYGNASEGLTPNGTRFNQTDIISPAILQSAIDSANMKDITVEDLQSVIWVRPVVQGNSYDESGYFISNQFLIGYSANKDTWKCDSETIVKSVVESFRDSFIGAYDTNYNAIEFDFSEIQGRDYLDSCEYYEDKAEAIYSYMKSMSNKDGIFKSSNNVNFQTISEQAFNVKKIMNERLRSYVVENGISKNAGAYMSRTSYSNVLLYFDTLKEDASMKNNLNGVKKYEDDFARIVLVPTLDQQDQFYMSQTRIGVDDMSKAALESGNNGSANRKSISENNRIISQLGKGRNTKSLYAQANSLQKEIEDELTRLSKQSKTIMKEYNESVSNGYMDIAVYSNKNDLKGIVMKIALYTILVAASLYICKLAVIAINTSNKIKYLKYFKSKKAEVNAEAKF